KQVSDIDNNIKNNIFFSIRLSPEKTRIFNYSKQNLFGRNAEKVVKGEEGDFKNRKEIKN
uniref:hypothetical protein n=1 Tax=Odoribacter laneus TaxID=626933 RepID=UPI004024D9DB